MSARRKPGMVLDSMKPLAMASSGPPSLSSLSTAIMEASCLPRSTIHDDSLQYPHSVSRQQSDVPFSGEPGGLSGQPRRGVTPVEDEREIEPPVSLHDHTKDHLLRAVFHVPDDDTTTLLRRNASPSEDYYRDLWGGTAPIVTAQISSPQALQREYDRDTWVLFARIHALQAARGRPPSPALPPTRDTVPRSLPAGSSSRGVCWDGRRSSVGAGTDYDRDHDLSLTTTACTRRVVDETPNADDADWGFSSTDPDNEGQVEEEADGDDDDDIFELELEL